MPRIQHEQADVTEWLHRHHLPQHTQSRQTGQAKTECGENDGEHAQGERSEQSVKNKGAQQKEGGRLTEGLCTSMVTEMLTPSLVGSNTWKSSMIAPWKFPQPGHQTDSLKPAEFETEAKSATRMF